MPRQKKISALVVSVVLLLVIGIAGTTQAQDTNKNINNQDLFTILGGLNQGIVDLQLYLQMNNLGGEANLGAIGEKKLEDYLPIIKYNEGLFTALPIVTSDAVYLTSDQSVGIRSSGGIAQFLQAGTWSALGGGGTPGNNGWFADAANNAMYPATNLSGTFYPIIVGVGATSSPATVDTELYVGGGGGLMITGVFNAAGAVWASSTAQVTGATTLYDDLTVYNGGGARIGTGSTGGHITALATDSLFVEGESEFDGITWFDESLRASSTLMVTGATTLVSTLDVTGHTTLANASSTNLSATTWLEVGGSTGIEITDGTITDGSGAISFDNENLTTTGNSSAANGTFTGSLTVDTDTLYVNNSTDRVGIGSTTPFATLSVDGNAGDNSFIIGSSTATILTVESDYDLNYKSGAFFLDYSSGFIGLGSTTPFTALGITNTGTQLSLAYDGTNYSTITTGSGGDLTVAASGGDISFSNENLVTTGTLGAATTTISSGDLVVDTNALIVKYLENRVGIGTTTPTYALSITDTGTQIGIAYDGTNYGTLAVGSGGDLTITATGGDISFSNENLATTGTLAAATTTVSTGLIVDTNTLLVDAINNRVGIGSTTPAVTLGIGANMTSTSTIMAGRLCMITAQEDGTVVYLRLGANQPANQPFATSTTPCNQ